MIPWSTLKMHSISFLILLGILLEFVIEIKPNSNHNGGGTD